MLALTFQIGSQRLALDVRRIREVVPRVPLQRSPLSPPWLAGTFVYRGAAIPVLDLHRLAGAGECPSHLSSRIILVHSSAEQDSALIGLLAAHVAEVREIALPAKSSATMLAPGQLDFGSAIVEGDTLLHVVDLDHLLPAAMKGQAIAAIGGTP